MRGLFIMLCAFGLVACGTASAGDDIGKWGLTTTTDPMTDAVSLNAHFITLDYGVGFAVTKGRVVMYFIMVGGGVQKYGLLSADEPLEYRVDHNPVHQFSDDPSQYVWDPKRVLAVIGVAGADETKAAVRELTTGKLLKVRFFTSDGAEDIAIPLAGACKPISEALGASDASCSGAP